MSKSSAGKPIIRASEIGAYVYCRRAWWLKRVGGFEPEGQAGVFARGSAAHEVHGRLVRQSKRQRRAALVLLAVGLILLALALVSFGVF